jgi:hypothetical protein
LSCTASDACFPWLGIQRTRIISPVIVTIQNSPRPMMPNVDVPTGESSGATRNVVQTASASTPVTVWTSSSRLPTWKRPAPCPPRIRRRVSTTTTAARAVST